MEHVSFLDIYPTIVELLGYNRPEFLEGHSLQPLLSDPTINWPYPAITTYEKGNVSIKMDQWNYIHYKNGSEELYNLTDDPHEFNNLIKQSKYKDIVAKLKSYIPKENLQ